VEKMFQQINAVASTLIVALVFLVATFWQSSGSNSVHERRGIATNRREESGAGGKFFEMYD